MRNPNKITRAKALKRVSFNTALLREKPQTLKSVLDVIFLHKERMYLNVLNAYYYDKYTYGDIYNASLNYAQYFIKNIKSEEKYIGIFMENKKEWIFSFYGLIIAGFIPVLLSTSNGIEDIEIIKNTINLNTIITDLPIDKENLCKINPFSIKEFKSIDSNQFVNYSDEILFLTSGTTGDSKLISYTGHQICNQIYNAKTILEDNPTIARVYKGVFKHLIILPFYHIFGLIAVLLWFSFFNVTFVIPKDLNPLSIKQACSLTHPTHIFAVPLFWDTIVNKVESKCSTEKQKNKLNRVLKFSYFCQSKLGEAGSKFIRMILKKYLKEIFGTSVKFCISGGASISENTLRIINCLGYPLVNGYGSTEFGIVSLNNVKNIKDRISTTVGKPFENIEYKIVDGNLILKSNSSATLILSTGEKIDYKNEYQNTNDVVLEKNGKLFILSRNDEIIVKENGENISFPEIESKLNFKVADEFALINNHGKISLILSFHNSKDDIQFDNELKNAFSKMEIFGIDSLYITFKKLPRANQIKLKRCKIVEAINKCDEAFVNVEFNKSIKQISSLNNHSEIGKMIELFSKVLSSTDVSENSDFQYDLGGDSLRFYLLISEIEESFHVNINLLNTTGLKITPKNMLKIVNKAKQNGMGN